MTNLTDTSIDRTLGDTKRNLRLDYLDGLRALAAVYVVLFHAGVGFTTRDLPFVAGNVRRFLTFGHDAVAVFIVLSGYCLMLPAARSNGRLTRGFGNYIARRAWRILPPYYATLGLSLALIAAFPFLRDATGTIWADTFPALKVGPIVSHLLLVHNFSSAWVYRINGPLWSVATEWQIYFFFPLLLLPVWRRFGAAATVVVGFVVGCLPIWLMPSFAAVCVPWYLGLFAVGMVAAGIGFSPRATEQALRTRIPWLVVVAALLAASVLGVTVFITSWFRFMPFSDALVGFTTASALIVLSRAATLDKQQRPLVLRLLEGRRLVSLGHFSYSLYLTHLPIVALCYFAIRRLSLSNQAQMGAMLALGVPSSLLVAYLFYLVFERRFVGTPPGFRKRDAPIQRP